MGSTDDVPANSGAQKYLAGPLYLQRLYNFMKLQHTTAQFHETHCRVIVIHPRSTLPSGTVTAGISAMTVS